MSCPGLEVLEHYVGGALEELARREVDSHVSSCASCRQRIAEVQLHLDLASRVVHASAWPESAAAGNKATAHAGRARSTTEWPVPGATRDTRAVSGAAPAPLPTISGYSVLREVSRGGQGVVYEAVDAATGQRVAIKAIRAGTTAGPSERARFELEMRVLRSLKHPNIVEIRDGGSSAELAFFVMEYIPGASLDVFVGQTRPTTRQSLLLFAKICNAVQAAHVRGVIHRDLKPSNVRVDNNGEPRVLDFGLAKLLPGFSDDATSLTATGQFVGSLPWASPEQAAGDPDLVDVRTDVYALGAILFHMLTGRPPFSANGTLLDRLQRIASEAPPTVSDLCSKADEELDAIVQKCLAKAQDDRYQSAGDLLGDVRNYLRGRLLAARAHNDWYVLEKTLHGQRAPVLVAIELLYRSLSGPGSAVGAPPPTRLASAIGILFWCWLVFTGMLVVGVGLTIAFGSFKSLILRSFDIVFAGAVVLPVIAIAGTGALRFLTAARPSRRARVGPALKLAGLLAVLVGPLLVCWRFVPGVASDVCAAIWAVVPLIVFLRGLAHALNERRSWRLAQRARWLASGYVVLGVLLCSVPALAAMAPPSAARVLAGHVLQLAAVIAGAGLPLGVCLVLASVHRVLTGGIRPPDGSPAGHLSPDAGASPPPCSVGSDAWR